MSKASAGGRRAAHELADDADDVLSEFDPQRAIVEALRESGGELEVSELVDEVVRRERDARPTPRTVEKARAAVPDWVFCLVSLGGLVSVVGSYFGVLFFSLLSVLSWATLAFGTLALLQLVSLRRE
ncbi:hypothetical protein [Halegenticoccus soli]|uniref:hypothetical protein n=1 Tax=Halegenticoccus soli TaxID=1985678 RepID=UPI000C6E0C88|nr:hypothetical protein [Halegenticoccus soli]